MEAITATLEKVVIGSLKRSADGPLLAWPLTCGSAVAARTRAMSFREDVLWVEVPDAEWKAELAHLAPRYLAVINQYSATLVDRIEFVIAGKSRQISNECRSQK